MKPIIPHHLVFFNSPLSFSQSNLKEYCITNGLFCTVTCYFVSETLFTTKLESCINPECISQTFKNG
jgi:hypothetical protein